MVDRRIRLDCVHEVVVRRRQRVDRPADRRDDADAQRADVAERAADRGDGLADLGRSRIAEGNGRERMGGRINLDQADIVEDVPADDRRGHAVPVPELDHEAIGRLDLLRALAGVRDHVGVREDVALAGNHEAGPLSLLPRKGVAGARDRIDRDDAGRTKLVDAARHEGAAGDRPRVQRQ